MILGIKGNTETPSDAPLCKSYPCTARPYRRSAEENPKKRPPCRDYKRIQPSVPHHLVTFCTTPSHWEVQLPSKVSHDHLRRPSMLQYVLLCKHLLMIPPIILVPKKSTCNRPERGHIFQVNILSPAIKHSLITAQTY